MKIVIELGDGDIVVSSIRDREYREYGESAEKTVQVQYDGSWLMRLTKSEAQDLADAIETVIRRER